MDNAFSTGKILILLNSILRYFAIIAFNDSGGFVMESVTAEMVLTREKTNVEQKGMVPTHVT